MDSEDHPDSVCDKCEGSCACSDPSDQSESLDSSDSDSDLIVLSSTEENIAASPHETSILSLGKTEPSKWSTDNQAEPVAETSLEVKPFKTKRIERKNPYLCHVCQKEINIQSDFVKHMQEQHPKDALQCERCSAQFSSPNGLFKHMRSHSYMKYKCDLCGHRFQFPYQINDHVKTHSGKDLYGCSLCEKEFASRSSCKAHERSHGVQFKCSACPDTTTKTYSSTTSLNIHKRGMHGEGWYSPCGQNCKWKSMYARHIKKCKTCIKKLADFRLNRYNFMRHIDLDLWNIAGHNQYTWMWLTNFDI